jgi:DNA-binding IclR family transcriptional regulator
MEKDSSVQISQADIGQMIGMKQQSVFVAMKTLIEAGVLRSHGKSGQTMTYILNPYYVSHGESSIMAKLQKKWDAAKA